MSNFLEGNNIFRKLPATILMLSLVTALSSCGGREQSATDIDSSETISSAEVVSSSADKSVEPAGEDTDVVESIDDDTVDSETPAQTEEDVSSDIYVEEIEVSEADLQQRVTDRASYETLQLTDEIDVPTQAADPTESATSLFGRSELPEGGQPTVVERQDFADHTVVLVTNIGLGDDSVRGERFRVEYEELNPGVWQMVWLGRQWQCGRGENAGEWVTQLCP